MFGYKKTILGILLLALATVGYAELDKERPEATVTFFDIGQGDAALIALPGDVQILIDGGPSDKILSKLESALPFYDKEIELVILTHPHADHLRGLNYVFNQYKVKNVLFSGARYESGVYRDFIERVGSEGARVYIAEAGDGVSWRGRPILEILTPEKPVLGQSFKKIHDSTVVSRLTLGGIDFLLTGDAEEPLERELVASGLVSDADVLKVGHHGSKTSTGQGFLAAALPEVVVISVGKNSYGHPHPEVTRRLERLGSKIIRTDEGGDIVWSFKLR